MLLHKNLTNSSLEFNAHFWFLHLGKVGYFKKVEKVSDKMTKDEEWLPLLARPGLFSLKTRWTDKRFTKS